MCLLFISFWAVAVNDPIEISSTKETIVIDGILQESEWENAKVHQLKYEVKPANNAPSFIKTEVMLAEDGENLYVAFRAFDPNPSKIRAFLRNRDQGFDDDRVEISIDTFNSAQTAYRFSVNAVGVQVDEIRDEINDEELLEWDGIWVSAAKISEFGYTVEIAIPYNILRVPNNDTQQWKINLQRFYPREQQYRFSLAPQDRNNSCEICQFSITQNINTKEAPTNFNLTPTLTYNRSKVETSIDQSEFSQESKDVGLDLRWGISPNTTLLATLNPDFSQVESDPATLEINQKFSTKQDEKRPFFVEGAEYFQTNIDLVHSRTIADPDYGFKMTTKTQTNLFTALIAQDAQTNIVLPTSQGSDVERLSIDETDEANISAAIRYQHQMGNGLSLGSLVTFRKAQDLAYQNNVVSVDSHWQMSDSDRLYIQAMSSSTKYPTFFQEEYEQAAKLNDKAYFAQYDHTSDTWYRRFRYQNIGKDFRADSGFVTQTDIESYHARVGYQWYGEQQEWWTKVDWKIDWDLVFDQKNNLVERKIESDIEVEGLWQSTIELGIEFGDEVYNSIDYAIYAYKLEANIKPFSGIDISAKLESGKTIDTDNDRLSDFIEYELVSELNIGQHILLDVTLQYESLDMPGGKVFDAYTNDVRLRYQFTNNSSLALSYIVEASQKNLDLYNAADDEAANERETILRLQYSYSLNPQTLFIAGYQQGKFNDDQITPENSDQRTVFMKLSYAWTP